MGWQGARLHEVVLPVGQRHVISAHRSRRPHAVAEVVQARRQHVRRHSACDSRRKSRPTSCILPGDPGGGGMEGGVLDGLEEHSNSSNPHLDVRSRARSWP